MVIILMLYLTHQFVAIFKQFNAGTDIHLRIDPSVVCLDSVYADVQHIADLLRIIAFDIKVKNPSFCSCKSFELLFE